MLTILRNIKDVNFDALMNLHRDYGDKVNSVVSAYKSNLDTAQDQYQYLKECFFTYKGAFCAAWAAEGRYLAFLRMEPYRDGYLLEGLRTAGDVRNKGYATKLMQMVLRETCFPKGGTVYSHVDKKNKASLRVHEKCGFSIVSERAVLIDGSVTFKAYTLHKII